MEEIKEIKSVTIVPFTLMNSTISAIMGLAYALIFALVLGFVAILSPTITSEVIGLLLTSVLAVILIFPTGSFLLSILSSFLLAFIYNLLVPRLGGIKLELHNMKEIISIPIIPVSLMVSTIYTIYTLIMMLIVAPILVISLQVATFATLSNVPALPELAGVIGTLGIIGIIAMVIGMPIMVFISVFVSSALMALLYNFLAPKIGFIKLKFKSMENNLFEIKKIKPIPLALIFAVITTIIQFISSIPNALTYLTLNEPLFALGFLFGTIVWNFVMVFIIYAILAILYNFLRPKIGGIELEME